MQHDRRVEAYGREVTVLVVLKSLFTSLAELDAAKQPPETMTSWSSTVFHVKCFLPYCTGFDLCLGNDELIVTLCLKHQEVAMPNGSIKYSFHGPEDPVYPLSVRLSA